MRSRITDFWVSEKNVGMMVMGFNVSPFRHYWFCGKCPCAGRDSGEKAGTQGACVGQQS